MPPRYDDNEAMLAWVDKMIDQEEQQGLDEAASNGDAYIDEWFGPAGEEARALAALRDFNNASPVRSILEDGKASPWLQQALAAEWGRGRLTARKSRAQRISENNDLFCVLTDVKRIKALIKDYFPGERAFVERAISLAIARRDDGSNEFSAKVTHARVGDELKRGPQDPKSLV